LETRQTVIEANALRFSYDESPVLNDVTLAITDRDFVSIVGPNGGGKTTLLKLMLGLISPQKGNMRVFGLPPDKARGFIGYMPQHAQLDPLFPVSVLDVVIMGRLGIARTIGPYSAKDKDLARARLKEVNLEAVASRPFSSLSGGQRQRVLIARALACEPKLLLLDEPTANLDLRVQDDLYALLRQLSERFTVVLVSHDVGFVSRFVKTVVCVNRTVHVHSSGELSNEAIVELYGRDVRLIHHDHSGPCAHREEHREAP